MVFLLSFSGVGVFGVVVEVFCYWNIFVVVLVLVMVLCFFCDGVFIVLVVIITAVFCC